jgi:NADH:ubiquinone oxidoreductase subunit E
LGCCGLAPVSTINEDIIGEVGEKKIDKLIKSIEEG